MNARRRAARAERGARRGAPTREARGSDRAARGPGHPHAKRVGPRSAWVWRGSRRAVPAIAGVVVIVLVALAALVWRSMAPRPAPAAMDPESAWAEYRTGVALGQQGRHLEGIPHLRRALESQVDFWAFHADYGTALFNASFEIGSRAGAPCAVTRSSWERIAMIREAMSQFEIAERLAPEPRERAQVEIRRADLARTWGLPLDALVAYRRAEAILPGQPDLVRRTNEFLTLLKSTEGLDAIGSEETR
jgi:tetratricopeptide (TPR) repeat protein